MTRVLTANESRPCVVAGKTYHWELVDDRLTLLPGAPFNLAETVSAEVQRQVEEDL